MSYLKKKSRRGKTRCLLIFLVAASLVLALAPVRRVAHVETISYCEQYGLRLVTRSGAGLETKGRSEEQTPLSWWVQEKFGANCEHSWVLRHTTGKTFAGNIAGIPLWRTSTAHGSKSPTPGILRLENWEKEKLETLFASSPKECRDYISWRLRGEVGEERLFDAGE